jgi:hypothetical protein
MIQHNVSKASNMRAPDDLLLEKIKIIKENAGGE